jgi:hypothetical protein
MSGQRYWFAIAARDAAPQVEAYVRRKTDL